MVENQDRAQTLSVIVVSYLSDLWKGYFDNVAVRTFHFDTWSRERLGSFHAAHRTAHTPAVRGDNLHVILTIEGLESGECLGNFHNKILPETSYLR